MANPFVHAELNTTDVDKAKVFYGKLFQWTLEDIPMGDGAYTMINVGKGTGGGMMKQPIPGAPSAWLVYIWKWGRPSVCGGLSGRPDLRKRRGLPHPDVIGQPLFVPFRLHDSLPAHHPFPAANLTSSQAFVTMDRGLD